MPGLLMPSVDETPLTPALLAIRKTRQAGCKTDPNPEKWYSNERGTAQALDEAYAASVCRRCPVRTLCAGWAFEMEDFGVWAGFTTPQRKRLRSRAPELVGELVMIVTALVNLSNGQGGTVRANTVGEVTDELAALYIRKGYAVRVTAPELASRATEILEDFDDSPAIATKRTLAKPKDDEPKQVDVVEDVEYGGGWGGSAAITSPLNVEPLDTSEPDDL